MIEDAIDELDLNQVRDKSEWISLSPSNENNELIAERRAVLDDLVPNVVDMGAIDAVYLMEKRYMPYYKWSFRGMREFSEKDERLAEMLEFLISSDNRDEMAGKKSEMIATVCEMIADELQRQQLTNCAATEMERQAYAVNDRIADGQIRNLHILSAV